MLDPTATNGLEAAFLDLLLDTIKSRRIILLKPLVLLCLRAAEAKLRVSIDEIALT